MATHHGVKHTDRLTRLHRGRHVAIRVVKDLLIERLTDHALIDAILLCHGLENLNGYPAIRLRDIDTRKTLDQRQVRGDMSIELVIGRCCNNLDPTRTRGRKQRLERFHSSSGELNHLVELVDEQYDFPALGLGESLSFVEQRLQACSHFLWVRQVRDHLRHVNFEVNTSRIIFHARLHEHGVVRNHVTTAHLVQVGIRVHHDARHLALTIRVDNLSNQATDATQRTLQLVHVDIDLPDKRRGHISIRLAFSERLQHLLTIMNAARHVQTWNTTLLFILDNQACKRRVRHHL